jgi:hypothetical protein
MSVDPCFDLSGSWKWKIDDGEYFPLRIEQRGGYAAIVRESGMGDNGPVDLATGAFRLQGAPLHLRDYFSGPFCLSEVVGQLDAGGLSLEASSSFKVWTMRCAIPNADRTIMGRRCHSDACPVCIGDCDDDGLVVVDELVTGINIVLERTPVAQCSTIDVDENGAVNVSELTVAVNRSLHGCE